MDIFSPMHIIVLLIIALLVFGPKRLPEIGSGLGKSIREFKQSMNQMGDAKEPPGTSKPQEYPTQAISSDPTKPE
ncbi:MAG: twin-arginine translocase TatA/TatE family subunit [Thermaerobacter sp.]|nr:twin-arginine translocase TatA/TatE family subunit [Thermaerobacter sp.]